MPHLSNELEPLWAFIILLILAALLALGLSIWGCGTAVRACGALEVESALLRAKLEFGPTEPDCEPHCQVVDEKHVSEHRDP